jgi:hypothetical protein
MPLKMVLKWVETLWAISNLHCRTNVLLIVDLDSITDYQKLITSERCPSSSYNTRIILGALYFTRWAGHVARIRHRRNASRKLAGKHEGKRPLGKPRCTCEDTIKMDRK